MNKKGFTLVELLAVIVVLSIVIGLATKSVISIRNNSLEKLLDTKINDLEGAAVIYGQENSNIFEYASSGFTFNINNGGEETNIVTNYKSEITVKELIDNNYYETKEEDSNGKLTLINNVTDKSMLCDTILVYRKNNRVYAVMKDIYSNDEEYVCNEDLKIYETGE